MTPAKLMLFVLMAVGLLVAVYIGKKVFATEEVPPPRAQTRMVPLAMADLEPGTMITENHLGRAPLNVEKIGKDTVLSDRTLIGRTVKKTIDRNSPISTDQLYGPGEYPSLPVGPGMQEYTVRVAGTQALLDGTLKPGNYVNVHLTVNSVPGGQTDGPVVKTILQGIRILRINRNSASANASTGENNITLELTPQEIKVVTLAVSAGTLTFSRSSKEARDSVNSDNYTLRDLLDIPEPEEEEEEEKPYTTVIYRRSGSDVNGFDKGTGEPIPSDLFRRGRNSGVDLEPDAIQGPRGSYGQEPSVAPQPPQDPRRQRTNRSANVAPGPSVRQPFVPNYPTPTQGPIFNGTPRLND